MKKSRSRKPVPTRLGGHALVYTRVSRLPADDSNSTIHTPRPDPGGSCTPHSGGPLQTKAGNDTSRPPEITASHLRRRAIIFHRHSTPQVAHVTGAVMFQDGSQQLARWGWPQERIEVLADEECSGAGGSGRTGLGRLDRMVSAGQVGIVLVTDLARLSRCPRTVASFLFTCLERRTLLATGGAILNGDALRIQFMALCAVWDVERRRRAIRRGMARKAKLALAGASREPQSGNAHATRRVTPCEGTMGSRTPPKRIKGPRHSG